MAHFGAVTGHLPGGHMAVIEIYVELFGGVELGEPLRHIGDIGQTPSDGFQGAMAVVGPVAAQGYRYQRVSDGSPQHFASP